MKLFALLGTAAAVALASAPAGAATAITFTNGSTTVNGGQTTTGTDFSDIFTFTTTGDMFVSGSFTTHSLTVNGTVVEDLDFTSITLDGLKFVNHSTSDANEQFSLPSSFLTAGGHTLTITYNVDTASTDQAATYAGNLYLANAGAVPEPATWAMFVGAFGLAGASFRRRKPVVRFA